MLNSASELILLTAGVNYEPTFVSTDKRVPSSEKTSLGYWQIGELQQYGFAKGPIFKVEFVDLASISATHVKIWGIDHKDDDAPIYPVTYLNAIKRPIDAYLKKFIFCNSSGVEASETTYTVVGYKKKSMLSIW